MEMDGKRIEGNEVYALEMCVSILLFAPIVVSQLIPVDKSQVEAWFNGIIKPVKERGETLNPELVKAETKPRIIKVMQGDPKSMLNLTFDSTAKQYGTIDSATLTTESSYCNRPI
ncbi:hypothetical protein Goshw_016885 [Gossypium schwendimanii]|uniref:Uncharacterized protein n=1 Tax=Gossypium schwendimanii TaxID=34291 RepID=A0A7J9N384_GOSSC|nr:hypothetical protein [Gossypium schwendimanii]